jgi:hypothetical protein
MRKIKEVLRLRFELGWGSGPLPVLVPSARAPFMEYLKRAEAAKSANLSSSRNNSL